MSSSVSLSSSPIVETGVTARSGRRRWTVKYKTSLVPEAERLHRSGEFEQEAVRRMAEWGAQGVSLQRMYSRDRYATGDAPRVETAARNGTCQ